LNCLTVGNGFFYGLENESSLRQIKNLVGLLAAGQGKISFTVEIKKAGRRYSLLAFFIFQQAKKALT